MSEQTKPLSTEEIDSAETLLEGLRLAIRDRNDHIGELKADVTRLTTECDDLEALLINEKRESKRDLDEATNAAVREYTDLIVKYDAIGAIEAASVKWPQAFEKEERG